MKGAPSIFKVIRSTTSSERMFSILDLSCEENDCFVYDESINQELKRRPIYECRCDERPKTIAEGFTRSTHIHWVTRGTVTPKDRDEVNRREVCECDG
jgi:hypothetical protein